MPLNHQNVKNSSISEKELKSCVNDLEKQIQSAQEVLGKIQHDFKSCRDKLAFERATHKRLINQIENEQLLKQKADWLTNSNEQDLELKGNYTKTAESSKQQIARHLMPLQTRLVSANLAAETWKKGTSASGIESLHKQKYKYIQKISDLKARQLHICEQIDCERQIKEFMQQELGLKEEIEHVDKEKTTIECDLYELESLC
eukprot:Platyproteum_vivax@DN13106_c0_g1_i1.p1